MTLVGCLSGIAGAGVDPAPVSGSQYGYDAATDSNRRQRRSTDLRSPDHIQSSDKRDKARSNVRDLDRNYAVAQWAVNKHLDFVAAFDFRAACLYGGLDGTKTQPSEDQVAEFNRTLKRFIKTKSGKSTDASNRHPLRRRLKLSEAMAVLDGDVHWHKRRDGKTALIAGDRIQDRRGVRRDAGNGREWRQGVLCDANLRSLSYAVHKRDARGRWVFQRQVPARHIITRAFYRTVDQVRGNSPLLAAYNDLRDTHETVSYGVAKLKMAQLLGYAIVRKHDLGDDDDVDVDENGKRYKTIPLADGPFQIELHSGDELKVIESNTPGSQFVDVNRACISIGLKALDIPFSMYDEAYTNFFGSKQALQLYKRSAEDKQADNQDLLNELTLWWIVNGVISGELELPPGWDIEDVCWQWVPKGIPWWDKAKDLRGDLSAIAVSLDNFERVGNEHGTGDPVENAKVNFRIVKEIQELYDQIGYVVEFGAQPRLIPKELLKPATDGDASGSGESNA